MTGISLVSISPMSHSVQRENYVLLYSHQTSSTYSCTTLHSQETVSNSLRKQQLCQNRNFLSLPPLNLLAYPLHLYPFPHSFLLPESTWPYSHQKLIPSEVHKIPSTTGFSEIFTSLIISSFLCITILYVY